MDADSRGTLDSEGRVKAEGLGLWDRSGGRGDRDAGSGSGPGSWSASESLAAEASDWPRRCLGLLDFFVVPFWTGDSEAARSSLSSWYLRRLSSGRTPFSR